MNDIWRQTLQEYRSFVQSFEIFQNIFMAAILYQCLHWHVSWYILCLERHKVCYLLYLWMTCFMFSNKLLYINRSVHMMTYFCLQIKLVLYNYFVLSHTNCCILLLGHDSNRILQLQWRSIGIISLNKYNSHTEPIFKLLNFLMLTYIYI